VGVLMLKCSTTGREFSTDIHVDEDSFRKLPDVVTKARCPHCGLMHNIPQKSVPR
jgi:DNA-directed RNA polymerase subunit RPC12/RpoP